MADINKSSTNELLSNAKHYNKGGVKIFIRVPNTKRAI